jgi:regulation of enolase protein 1 (concanavalin A-like superfamily)
MLSRALGSLRSERHIGPLLVAVILLAVSPASASAALQSDEFNGSTLDTNVWSFVDPVGDSSVSLGGGHASIAIPAWTSHDLWAGVDEAPRLLQAAPDSDFEVEVKFDSAVQSQYQLQGVVVRGGPSRLLRLEVHSDGSATNLFAASLDNGVATVQHFSTVTSGAPAYLRVKRAGNLWILRHSRDGQQWSAPATFTWAMAVDAVGPFAGSSGAVPPGFTAAIDYFRVIPPDGTPPAISNVQVSKNALAAKLTWTTDEPATSQVQYGPDSAYGSSAGASGLTQSHSVRLQRLSCGTTYHYRVRSVDEAGNVGSSPDATLTTSPCPTQLSSDPFGGTQVDEGLWSFVDPVGDASVSVSGGTAAISVPAGVNHDLWSGSTDAPRLLQAAPNADFDVIVKFDSPVTQQFQMQGLVVEQDADDLVRVDVHSDGSVTRLFAATMVDGAASVRHMANVTGGAPAYLRLVRDGDTWTLRYARVAGEWSAPVTFTHAMQVRAVGPFAGNNGGPAPAFTAQVDSFEVIPPDTTAPVISNRTVAPSALGATVRWHTDEPATSEVQYGPTSSYGTTIERAGMRSDHSVSVGNLRCGATYHYRVGSSDEAGNTSRSADATFTTSACPTALTTDEFGGTQLNTALWSFVSPLGDVDLSVAGGLATMSLPAGVTHDLWNSATDAPRLLQAAPNTDLDVEVKFDSSVSDQFQMQGLVVQQDADDLLRLEVHSDGSSTKLFAASMVNGLATTRYLATVAGGPASLLRLRRVGDRWTLRASPDGVEWSSAASFTHALTVSAIGPFAANAGRPAPALAAAVDYFRVMPSDATPPVISSVSSSSEMITATVRWTTDESATSEVAYREIGGYSGTVAKTTLVRNHSVVLRRLRCGTTYHFRARSADATENLTESPETTLTTSACPDKLTSDEFDGTALNGGLWSFLDPIGDGTASVSGGRATIALGGGLPHDLWSGANDAPRLLQPAPNSDFEVEVKFTSAVTQRYQMQGIVVEQDPDSLLRLEVHYDGTATKLFAAAMVNGVMSTKQLLTVTDGPPTFLRLKRVADRWTLRYSRDGSVWEATTTFTQALRVGAIGPFAGNSGAAPPAFSAGVDYFRVIPPPPPDVTPPVISGVSAAPGPYEARIAWSTDEPSTSEVEYGRTTAYSSGPVSAAQLVGEHAMWLRGLECAKTYHFRVASGDASGNVARSKDRTFTTGACPPGGAPHIDLWYGPDQTFGGANRVQRWFSVLGRATDPDGIAWVDYSLNGGSRRALTISPDGNPRIAELGDFNVELDPADLLDGPNTVRLFASDRSGRESTTTVTVRKAPAAARSLPHDVNWSAATKISDAGQVVDGRWLLGSGSIRTAAPGYDRIVAVGDMSWSNYEVTAPVTIHSLSTTSPHAGVGIAVGWRGHDGTERPRVEWPLGSLCFYYRDTRTDPFQLWMAAYPAPFLVGNDGSIDRLVLGTQYMWKVRTQTLSGNPGMARYSCKVWPASGAEPAGWDVSVDLAARAGAIAMVADYADVSIGNVTVRSIGG